MTPVDPALQILIIGVTALGGGGAAAILVWGFVSLARARTHAAAHAPRAAPAAPVEEVLRRPPADLRSSLLKTRSALLGGLDRLLGGERQLDSKLMAELETLLFGADLGVSAAEELLQAARSVEAPDRVPAALEARALEMLSSAPGAPPDPAQPPRVVLVVGVNGSGKTTSIGKLAARWRREGKRVLVAASDTFRAAAIDQLEVWAERAGAELVKGSPGGDPAAVAYDAVRVAVARQIDVVLIDTAGRLQTDRGLMDELRKIVRVVKKEVPEAPHEILLVLDANTGQNAIRQAQEFARAADVTGIVLAKLDGTAKGGVVLGVAREVGIPVRYVGVGEALEDLCDFDPRSFVRALFSRAGDAGVA